jgi:hypothetical protein
VGAGLLLAAFALVGILTPLFVRLWNGALGILWLGAVYAGVFWMLTGLLPAPLGRNLRRGGVRLARSAARLLGRLLRG